MKSTFLKFAKSLGILFTPAQSTLYATLFDNAPVPETEMALEIFGFTGEVPRLARKTKVMIKGARIGGTRFGALAGLWYGLTCDDSKLAPDEPLYVAFVGPDMRLSRTGLGFARGEINSSPALKSRVISDSIDLIVLRRDDGRLVHFVALPATAGGAALRGRWYAFVHFIEFAFFRDSNSVVNDADCYGAVRVRTKGAILIESTPWTERGLLYEFDRDNFTIPTTATVAHCPTPLIRTDDASVLEDVEAEYLRDPDSAANNYGCTFLGGGAEAFFDEASIRASVDTSIVLGRRPSGFTHYGADVGLVSDESVIVRADREADGVISIGQIVALKPKKGAPLKLSEVIATFAATMAECGASCFMADGHVREPAREHAATHHIKIDSAPEGNAGKFKTYELVRRLLREGRLKLPDHPRLLQQLRTIVAKPMPGGGWSISSPRRAGMGHGDIVSALVLAVWAAHRASRDSNHHPAPRPEIMSFDEHCALAERFRESRTIDGQTDYLGHEAANEFFRTRH